MRCLRGELGTTGHPHTFHVLVARRGQFTLYDILCHDGQTQNRFCGANGAQAETFEIVSLSESFLF